MKCELEAQSKISLQVPQARNRYFPTIAFPTIRKVQEMAGSSGKRWEMAGFEVEVAESSKKNRIVIIVI